jgi:CDP-paratose 2-epimerase
MNTAIITGSAGLIGAQATRFFAEKGFRVVGIDNDMRARFFGAEASTKWCRQLLELELSAYEHHAVDIRSFSGLEAIFQANAADIKIVVHTAAQPSHDWAARDPITDFTVNANGTLHLLELTRQYCPEAVFIFTSTNKVYGDAPNALPLVELETRWELDAAHGYAAHGIDETMSLDQCKHSLFGASKVAADVLVQEYGRYFGLKTACFRGGCLTGPNHSGTQLHGFLAYLMKCAIQAQPYTVHGYKGKQVRDNIHSYDLVNMFWHFYQNPRSGAVYNAGGSRFSNCSMLEAIRLCEHITGRRMNWTYSESSRVGDHIWWISDVRKFREDYPSWEYHYDLETMLVEIHDGIVSREAALVS